MANQCRRVLSRRSRRSTDKNCRCVTRAAVKRR
jgi:hypothetical protein